jgi:DNA-binding CsgD family transcriptional regulator
MLGLLELSLGRPADAVPALQTCGRLSRQFGLVELGHLQWAAELIEAEMRCGRNAYSADTLQVMRRAAHPGATSLNRALLARCEGILTTDSSWEDSFRRAIELHGGPNLRPFELARTQLCFGERLRRHRRRRDARHQLSQAWETFADLGADAWAQRASQEIAALGGGAPGPVRHVTDLLTPQEFQVAATVAGGATNREAASALFLSQKTIEFHLSNIYRRLGVRSRAELAAALEGRNRAQENSQRPGPAPAG